MSLLPLLRRAREAGYHAAAAEVGRRPWDLYRALLREYGERAPLWVGKPVIVRRPHAAHEPAADRERRLLELLASVAPAGLRTLEAARQLGVPARTLDASVHVCRVERFGGRVLYHPSVEGPVEPPPPARRSGRPVGRRELVARARSALAGALEAT